MLNLKQRLKMSALKQGGWRNKWQLLNLVTLYSSGVTSENEGPLPSITQNNLADIGKSYTANDLPSLGSEDDYAIATYRLGDKFVSLKM